jgi:putative transcriptional regulator
MTFPDDTSPDEPVTDAVDPAPGRLLVATPVIDEPTFARTVVLLLQAGGEDGALGVVLNRPSDLEVSRVLPGWDDLAHHPAQVFEGGPVQPQAAICLARLRSGVQDAPGVAPLASQVPGPRLATVDLDAAPEQVAPALTRLRVFAGYAGWTAGQLEAEVAEGAWWVLDALPDDPFPSQPELLWQQVLRRQGPPLSFAVTLPADPTQN